MKNYKSLFILFAAVIIVIAGAGAIAIVSKSNNDKKSAVAQQIPDGAYFKQVKQLSEGQRPACLADNAEASTAVGKISTKNPGESFGLVLGSRIIDIPAGYTTDTVNSFDGTTAKGTIKYTDKNQKAFVGDLDSFNYAAMLNPNDNSWKLTSFIACN